MFNEFYLILLFTFYLAILPIKPNINSNMQFKKGKISPKIDHSSNVITHVSNKLSERASMFLKMFGSHPMAQFYVPDKHKTGGGELESDLAENEDFDVPYFSEN